jgi:8-oxo-dGTP pyrophosphatase MutT (NUDIX family)
MSIVPWKVLGRVRDASYRLFSIRTDTAVNPRTGKAHDFYILESADWVNVVALTPEQEVVLVRQYRHGAGALSLEIPGGLVEAGDSAQSAALRELEEETGYQGRDVRFLGSVSPNPAIQNNLCHTYLVLDARPRSRQNLDDKEDIETVLEPLDKIPGLIREGVIDHSLVLSAFFLYLLHYPFDPAQVRPPGRSG